MYKSVEAFAFAVINEHNHRKMCVEYALYSPERGLAEFHLGQ